MIIDVLHISKLANLPLKSNEIKKLEEQLTSIIDYIEKLKKANTENVEETSQITNLVNVEREDNTLPSFTQEEALKNAKSQHNGLIKVNAIFEQ